MTTFDSKDAPLDALAAQCLNVRELIDAVGNPLMRAAIELDLPVLGLCRGMQVLNVALGGTLHQDIGTEAHWMQYVPVDLEPGSRGRKDIHA